MILLLSAAAKQQLLQQQLQKQHCQTPQLLDLTPYQAVASTPIIQGNAPQQRGCDYLAWGICYVTKDSTALIAKRGTRVYR